MQHLLKRGINERLTLSAYVTAKPTRPGDMSPCEITANMPAAATMTQLRASNLVSSHLRNVHTKLLASFSLFPSISTPAVSKMQS